MENKFKKEVTNKMWKKVLSLILSVIIAFGTVVTIMVGSSRLQDWLGIQSMLSAYAAEIVDTHGAVAVDEESMLEDHNVIDLENKDGSNTLYLFSESISFVDENGRLKTKDISVEKQSDKKLKEQGYDYTNGQNDYRVNFSSDSDKGLYVEFGNCSYSIIPHSDKTVVGAESTSEILNEQFEDFEYRNIYGEGTNLKFYPQLNGVKDEIVLDKNIGQDVFSFTLKTENCSAVLNDDGTVSLISNDDGSAVQTFSAPYAYDSAYVEGDRNAHYIDCSYTLDVLDENTYTMSVNADKAWLDSESTVYPVTIDPTTSNVYDSADAGVYSKYPSNNYGNEQTGCFGKASDYGYGRVYEKFNIPSAIQKGATIKYAYHWVRETTGRTASTYVRPFLVTSSWSETGITWNNKPSYETVTNTNWKNINSNSKDSANNPYWYNYNLVNCVKKWINGTANNGVVFVSGEEVDEVQKYEWRAFASRTYSTSSMRPYTVISYENDTTAPTATVKANTAEWTNGNVTLSISGAADNSGGAGLHTQPYSFSTVSGTYSWGTAASKAFSENTTVYVSVRDALGNIRTYTHKITNIDKTAPTISSVTGNPTDWTDGSVTLTVNGAKDGESGLSDTAYSFSTESGSYSWQESSSKTFGENTTVYVYVRDNAGNISAPTEITVDRLDNAAPSVPEITGNSEEWTDNNIELTAQSTDDLSGVAEYSFSAEKDKFNWQRENTFTAAETSKLYVYARDNAGNISEPAEIDLKIDRLAPSGSAAVNSTDWVKEVTITASADDTMSGLAANPYSFSAEKEKYIWQSSNNKTVRENGTYYVYARDKVGNINLIDTVVVDKIDKTAPVIDDVAVQENGNILTITVHASDAQSGVAEYSADDGTTWQTDNVLTVDKSKVNFYAVRVKDKVGNVSSIGKSEEFSVPKMYFENETLFLYNAGIDSGCSIYYKFSAENDWLAYYDPIIVPENAESIYLSFYQKEKLAAINKIPLNFEYSNKLAYTESSVDMTMAYQNVAMSIGRQYVNEEWQYSFDSILSLKNDNSLIEIRLTDFNTYSFVQQSKYKYVSEISKKTVTVVYDEQDENIVEYIYKADKINYHYAPDGRLVKIDNAYGILYSFDRSKDSLVITDGAGRETVIRFNSDGISSITDANGGTVHYEYKNGNLVKVTDQSGAIISEYEYTKGVITKSGYTNISRDSKDRVTELLNDNGYYARYVYDDKAKSFTVTTPDDQCVRYDYDYTNTIFAACDSEGIETHYAYCYFYLDDEEYNLEHELLREVCQENQDNYYYALQRFGNKPFMETIDDCYNDYFYDENGLLTRIEKTDTSDKDNWKYSAVYYLYDENGNVTLQATLNAANYADISEEYDVDREYESVVKYWYENGMVTKTEDVTNSTITMYQYDKYGNAVKTTTEVTKDGETTLSVSDSTYDILGNVVSTRSGESETIYTYDAAGRTLLVNADGMYRRTVYDDHGRTVQEIEDADYNSELDNLPNAYSDTNVGQRYIYDSTGNLIQEINRFDLATDYIYSDGVFTAKHFDIYDYYYNNKGNCEKVDVNGKTIVDYDYKVTDNTISTDYNQYVNRVIYANGYSEEQAVNRETGMIMSRCSNDSRTLNYKVTSSYENSFSYEDKDLQYSTTVAGNAYNQLIQKTNTLTNLNTFIYKKTTTDNVITIEENHFYHRNFKTVIKDNSITYSSDKTSVELLYDFNDNEIKQTVKNGDLESLRSVYTYDDSAEKAEKTYNLDGISFVNYYNDKGYIESDEKNQYEYDKYGELINVTGEYNSSYTYDDRGNMLSKIVDGQTTTFSYDSDVWDDQLTAVNDVPLTYDENGNLITYGERTFEWSRGKQLSQITDGENTYSYKYDENGIRATKTVNGKIYEYNTKDGVILAQRQMYTPDIMYFQYDNAGVPFGFYYAGAQYLYITNLNGDVVGITDIDGNLIASYTYDEWGKLLAITPAEEGNTEQISLAKDNPLRYRGYYYDSETGYYYLQSRYYDPEIGRFISADDFDYIDADGKYTTNAYAYCSNSPLNYNDVSGHYYYNKEYDLGNGWKGVIVRPSNAKKAHVKVYKGKKMYSQDIDGKPTDNSTGSPPSSAKNKLKDQTGWDWDTKEESYKEQQKENTNEFSWNLDFGLNLDFSNLADLVIALLLVLICVPTGVFIGFLIFGLLIKPPVGVPA